MYTGSLEAFRFDYDVVYTNTMAAGAYRGYGAPQGCFALECAVHELASILGIDAFKIREMNMLHEGDFMASINGNPANPTFVAGLLDTIPEDDFEDFGLLRFPAANTVYRLTPSTSGIHSYADMNVSVYPNPVSDLMTINGADNALVQIFDVNGKLLVSEVYNQPISVSELPSGLYMVKITTDQGSVVKKIVK